jgi:hypothetical protein
MHDPAHMRRIKLPYLASRDDEIGGISIDELKLRQQIVAGAAHPGFADGAVIGAPLAVLLVKASAEGIAAADLGLLQTHCIAPIPLQ